MLATDRLTDIEIVACTLIGESESLGEQGMTGTALTIVNRAAANLHWLGGNTLRGVCLRPKQYQVWTPGSNDYARVLNVAENNPFYGPYVMALGIAGDALANRLTDFTDGAVSYYDSDSCDTPGWARGKLPCYVEGARFYYDLKAIS